jgi:GTPase involved in cell partitioning and DNA repair
MDLEKPTADLDNIVKELKRYDPILIKKPKLLAMGKMDLPEGKEALAAFKKAKGRVKIYPFSSFTGAGLDELKWAIWEKVRQ